MDNYLFQSNLPLSLYVHIPWCIKKCPYCDFNSHSLNNKVLPEKKYVNALITELEDALPLIWGRTINTIFIGGGTPSLFSGRAIDELLTAIRSRVKLSPFAEITMEANPGAVDNNNLKDYKLAGVNRLSLGVQSFNDMYLEKLGRVHSGSMAFQAIEIAQECFENFNLDLMYGLPNQSLAEACRDIETALGFSPSHISCYNLTIEPNTAFYASPPPNLPDNDKCFIMQEAIINLLQESGYKRYEISAFAKDNSYCKHNLNYWQFGDYLGIGAGAHSKLTFFDKVIRRVTQKHPAKYLIDVYNKKHIIEHNQISFAELPFEFALNAFRLIDGFNISLFNERTALPLKVFLEKLLIAEQKGFVELRFNKINITKLGQDFLNELLILFLT